MWVLQSPLWWSLTCPCATTLNTNKMCQWKVAKAPLETCSWWFRKRVVSMALQSQAPRSSTGQTVSSRASMRVLASSTDLRVTQSMTSHNKGCMPITMPPFPQTSLISPRKLQYQLLFKKSTFKRVASRSFKVSSSTTNSKKWLPRWQRLPTVPAAVSTNRRTRRCHSRSLRCSFIRVTLSCSSSSSKSIRNRCWSHRTLRISTYSTCSNNSRFISRRPQLALG